MIEGKLSSVVAEQAVGAGTLHAFAWDELVAKLAAARDLRELFAGSRGGSLASFAPQAARALALCESAEGEADQGCINPDALGHGKGVRANTIAAAGEAGDCDREMQ